jgi:hypothetical protein
MTLTINDTTMCPANRTALREEENRSAPASQQVIASAANGPTRQLSGTGSILSTPPDTETTTAQALAITDGCR